MAKIPFIVPNIPPLNEMLSDFEKLHSNNIFSNSGPFEQLFESKIVEYLQSDVHVTAVSNATMGLMIALKAIASEPGIVLLPAFTFAATVEAVLWNGLTPVFVDIDTENWIMKFDDGVEQYLQSGNVRAVLFCNPFGIGSNIKEWENQTKKYGVPLLIDSAAGLGSTYADGKMVGTKGNVEVLSLHATKTFGIGEGGLVITKSKRTAQKIRRLKNFGFNDHYIVTDVGLNAKMGEIYSIIGLHVLAHYHEVLTQKKALLSKYLQLCQNKFHFPHTMESAALQFFPLLLHSSSQRKKIENDLQKKGIMYRRYYFPSLDHHPAFKDIACAHQLVNTHHISSRLLALPLHTNLSIKDIDTICAIIHKHV